MFLELFHTVIPFFPFNKKSSIPTKSHGNSQNQHLLLGKKMEQVLSSNKPLRWISSRGRRGFTNLKRPR
ncbi:hypothetical protein Y1Q_0003159 [Alligator mississippiensis]|uniref:Uncharacterized protein n=1 Tax=Alligator mississippiensis TaxID=8496 RepID=A0A151MDR8_ALLMI|nr:hypothetical protein Y1Q_0003159 [Alligator mississippiensis]